MLIRSKTIKLTLALTAMSLLMACGGQSYRPGKDGQNQSPQPNPYPTYPYPWPTYTPPAGGGNPQNTSTITASFSLNGVNGVVTAYDTRNDSIQIVTDNLLQVRIRAGQAGPLTLPNGNTPFTANYSCVSYLVTVNGRSVRTQPLLANGQPSPYCPDGVPEQTIDFSDRVSPGSGTLYVRVTEPRYDFYCQLWIACQPFPYYAGCAGFGPNYQNLYCPTRVVYQTHTVTGDLDILTNGD